MNLTFEIGIRTSCLVSIYPNGAVKQPFFNLLTGVYQPTSGRISFLKDILLKKRTQLSLLKLVSLEHSKIYLSFTEMSVIDNVKVGPHYSHPYTVFDALFHTPKYKKSEVVMQEEAFNIIGVFSI